MAEKKEIVEAKENEKKIEKNVEEVKESTGEKTVETKPEEPEMIYTIPLGKVYNQPWSKRSRKAVRMVKEFLRRHTKQEIKIGNDVNHEIWKRGMKHPPRKIRVKVVGGVATLVK